MDTAVSQCGPVLRSLPSSSPPLFKLCQTTINQHKLYSLTTSLKLCSSSTLHNSWHITNTNSRLLSLQVHFTVTLCPHYTTHRPKLSAKYWPYAHKEPWRCAFIGHIGEYNLPLINISPKYAHCDTNSMTYINWYMSAIQCHIVHMFGDTLAHRQSAYRCLMCSL